MENILLKKRREEIIKLFDTAPIKHVYGMELSYDNQGNAVFDLPYNSKFDHAMGGTHGGAIATLLDNAGWFTLAPHFDHWIATVEFSTRLLAPVSQSHLRAIGKIIRLGKKISVAEMKVTTDKEDLIACGSGTFMVTSVPFQLS